MTGAVVVGQNVILRPDSVFAGKSPNPPSGVVGEVLSFDNEWVDILWSTFTESLNYRKEDINTVGNPPSLIGWDWNQAYIDSKNQDIGIILNRINPSSLDYDEAFSAMYAILLRSGIVPDRANFVQLLPTLSSGGMLTSSWAASGDSPAGTLTVSSVYNNDITYSSWKMLDSNTTGSYWYPLSGTGAGSWWQVAFSNDCYFQKVVFTTYSGKSRPSSIRVDVGSDVASLHSIGVFSISPASTGQTTETFILPSSGFNKVLRVTVMSLQDPLVAGYSVFDLKLYGVHV